MKVHCRTNLDLAYEQWPEELPCLPNIGDKIQSKLKHGSFQLQLDIVAITWKYDWNTSTYWYPEIELNTKLSLVEFYEWYAPLVVKSVSAFI